MQFSNRDTSIVFLAHIMMSEAFENQVPMAVEKLIVIMIIIIIIIKTTICKSFIY